MFCNQRLTIRLIELGFLSLDEFGFLAEGVRRCVLLGTPGKPRAMRRIDVTRSSSCTIIELFYNL